jgi:plasmid stabilization system protein ParE
MRFGVPLPEDADGDLEEIYRHVAEHDVAGKADSEDDQLHLFFQRVGYAAQKRTEQSRIKTDRESGQ